MGVDTTGVRGDYESELTRLRDEVARMRAAIFKGMPPKFAQDLDPVTMIEEERKVWRDGISAYEQHVADLERKLAVAVEEIRAWRRAKDDATIELAPGPWGGAPTRETEREFEVVRVAMDNTDAAGLEVG